MSFLRRFVINFSPIFLSGVLGCFSSVSFAQVKGNTLQLPHKSLFRYNRKELRLLRKISFLDHKRLALGLQSHNLSKKFKKLKKQVGKLQNQKVLQTKISQQLILRIRPRLLMYYRIVRLGKARILLGARTFKAMAKRWRVLQKLTVLDISLLKQYQQIIKQLGVLTIQIRKKHTRLKQLKKAIKRKQRALVLARAKASDALEKLLRQSQRFGDAIIQKYGSQAQFLQIFKQWRDSYKLKGLWKLQGHLRWPIRGFSRHCRKYKLKWRGPTPSLTCLRMRFRPLSLRDSLGRGGLELFVPTGTPIRSITHGKVIYQGWLHGYGRSYIIDHGKRFYSIYSHLLQFGVEVGERVRAGQIIGTSGSSGMNGKPRLYFELRFQGRLLNPFHWMQDLSSP